MGKWKRGLAAALSLCLMAVLAACGGGLTEKDAETYIKGHLDAAYLGIYNKEYIDLTEGMTEAEAKEMHESNVADETEYYFLSFLEIEYPTDEIVAQAEDVMEKIYAKSKYTVGTGSKTKDGDFVVEVTVSPLNLSSIVSDEDFFEALEQAGYLEAEDVDRQLLSQALDLLEERLDDVEYGKDQILMLQLKPDEDGYYSLVEAGMQKVDEVMVDYYGDYAE